MDGIINDTGTAADVVTRQTNKINKQVIFRNCVPFTDCLEKINNKQGDNAKGLYVVMPMYNLINTVIIMQKYQKMYGSITKMI